jgi:hypothetical protein
MENNVPELLNQIISILSQPISISDIISLILTAISVFAAIFVPYRIMEKQNKIAIFEKRFEILLLIERILNYANAVEKLKSLPEGKNPTESELATCNLQIWFSMFNKSNSFEEAIPKDFLSSFKTIDEILNNQTTLLLSADYLFGKDVSKFVLELEQKYETFIKCLSHNMMAHTANNYSTSKAEFVSYVRKNKDYKRLFNKYLKLK